MLDSIEHGYKDCTNQIDGIDQIHGGYSFQRKPPNEILQNEMID